MVSSDASAVVISEGDKAPVALPAASIGRLEWQPGHRALVFWTAFAGFALWAVKGDRETLLNGWWMVLLAFWFTANSFKPAHQRTGRLRLIALGLAACGAAFLIWGTYREFELIFDGLWVGPRRGRLSLFRFPIRGLLVSLITATAIVPWLNRVLGRYTVPLSLVFGLAIGLQEYGSELFNLKRWLEHCLGNCILTFIVLVLPLVLAALSERIRGWHWPSGRVTRALARVWGGELSVWVVVPLLYPMTMAAVIGLIRLYSRLSTSDYSYWQRENLKVAVWIVMVWLLIAGSSIAWRTLTRAGTQGRRVCRGLRWVVILLAAPPVLDTVTSTGFLVGDSLTKSAAAALGGVYQIDATDHGIEIHLTGDVTFGMAAAFHEALADHPEVKRVRLKSDGGDIREAFLTAQIIAAHNLDTVVDSDCASACTILFVSGKQRILDGKGRLGFHAAHSADPTGTVAGSFAWAFAPFNVDAKFVKKVESVKPSDVWYPTREELLRWKIVTE